MRLGDLVRVREGLDPGGDVLEEPRRSPVRHEHDVGREEIRQSVGGGRGPDLGLVVVGRDDGHVDLVLVRGVVRIDERLGANLGGRAAPHRDVGSVVDAGAGGP